MSNDYLHSSAYEDGYAHGVYASEDAQSYVLIEYSDEEQVAEWFKGYQAGRAQRKSPLSYSFRTST